MKRLILFAERKHNFRNLNFFIVKEFVMSLFLFRNRAIEIRNVPLIKFMKPEKRVINCPSLKKALYKQENLNKEVSSISLLCIECRIKIFQLVCCKCIEYIQTVQPNFGKNLRGCHSLVIIFEVDDPF